MKFHDIFPKNKPIIAVIHLLPLPGSPLYEGNPSKIYEQALSEAEIFERQGVHGIIIENFRDIPFYPDRVPAETVAFMSSLSREIINKTRIPLGINVLRNDGESAIAIATAVNAAFVRVNVHTGAIVSEQGIIQSIAHKTLRLRQSLQSKVLIFADVGVKHAAPLVTRGLGAEARDAEKRGLADALIVSGEVTGAPTSLNDIEAVRQYTKLPILIGSGATPENLGSVYNKIDGCIVGSYFKTDSDGNKNVEEERVKIFMQKYHELAHPESLRKS